MIPPKTERSTQYKPLLKAESRGRAFKVFGWHSAFSAHNIVNFGW
jgi:hypothetical protein